MNEHLDILQNWSSKGLRVALARVVKTWGSSPRPVGSIMLINEKGEMSGSVSGGCVEGVVVKKAQEVFDGAKSLRLAFGVSDEEAWSVGLSCGGSIQVFIQEMDLTNGVWADLVSKVKANESATMISLLADGSEEDVLVPQEVGQEEPVLISEARKAHDDRTNRSITLEERDYFIHVFPHQAQLLVIGAAHITVDLVDLGNQFGFETVVIDPRGYFAENIHFPEPPSQLHNAYPSEVLNDFPLDPYTFCAVLSHDPKIDDNALEILLPSKVAYIGALGSRKTHAKRTKRLLEKGISQEMIDRISAPIGLPINARSAKEIALAIMGQIIEVKNQHMVR
ncbi:MAG: XdhC family protein [Bacteroidota bacterium]